MQVNKRRVKGRIRAPLRLVLLCLLSLSLLACERKPADLEQWRNAKGGIEKIETWFKSPEEPMPVRIRAAEILVEEGKAGQLQPILEKMDEGTRESITAAVAPTVEKMWAKQDFPKMPKEDQASEEEKKRGLMNIKVGDSEAIKAKDAAYHLQEFAKGEAKAKYEAILAAWISEDWDLRNQLGDTTIGQIAPRAGKAGTEKMLKWVTETKKPQAVAEKIRTGADEETKKALARALIARAKPQVPNIEQQLWLAIIQAQTEEITPILEDVMMHEEASPGQVDAAMDRIVALKGERATPMFVILVGERQGLMRWVAAQRIIEVRGEPGVLSGANALPLEVEKYSAEFSEETEKYCNFVGSELRAKKVKDISGAVRQLLTSVRWPSQVLGLRCAEVHKLTGLKEQVEALKESKQALPPWGKEGEEKTVGGFAAEVSKAL